MDDKKETVQKKAANKRAVYLKIVAAVTSIRVLGKLVRELKVTELNIMLVQLRQTDDDPMPLLKNNILVKLIQWHRRTC